MNMLPMPMHQLKDFDSTKSMSKEIDDFMEDVYDGKISDKKPSSAKNDTKTWNKRTKHINFETWIQTLFVLETENHQFFKKKE